MKISSIFSIFLILSLTNISIEYLVLPFKYLNNKKSKLYNFENISGKDFLEFSTNKLISSISIGSPYNTLDLYLTMDYKLFFIGKGYCHENSKSSYNPSYSNTYINKSFYPAPFDDLRDMTIGNDLISLYNDYNLKTNITLNDVLLYYGKKEDNYNINGNDNLDKVCGIMGFKLHSQEDSYYNKFRNFYYILKTNNITNYTFWAIEFFNEEEKERNNNYDGYLILGAGDKNYLKGTKNIDVDEIHYSYSSHLSSSIEWMINFNLIYYSYPEFNNVRMNPDLSKVEFNFDIDYYFSTKEYFESIKNNFFDKYISKGICKINKLNEFYLRYNFIICDMSFKDELIFFPNLNMFSDYLNYNFQLTYKDLFKEVNNQIIFLMFYNPWTPKNFLFGKKFLEKYHFIFRYDQKTIGFLNYNKTTYDKNTIDKRKEIIENKTRLYLIIIVVLLSLFIIIIIGIVISRKRFDKKRKKRANELADEYYEYDYKNESING